MSVNTRHVSAPKGAYVIQGKTSALFDTEVDGFETWMDKFRQLSDASLRDIIQGNGKFTPMQIDLANMVMLERESAMLEKTRREKKQLYDLILYKLSMQIEESKQEELRQALSMGNVHIL